MRKITQNECLEIFDKTPFPRTGGELRFVQRFMFRLNDLAKKRGYRLFHWTDYLLHPDHLDVVGSWILSNIEPLSRQIIDEKKNIQNDCSHSVPNKAEGGDF
jgi:hypothetical protein